MNAKKSFISESMEKFGITHDTADKLYILKNTVNSVKCTDSYVRETMKAMISDVIRDYSLGITDIDESLNRVNNIIKSIGK